MFVPVACLKCGKMFQVPAAAAGTEVACPWCKAVTPALPVAGLTPPPHPEPDQAPGFASEPSPPSPPSELLSLDDTPANDLPATRPSPAGSGLTAALPPTFPGGVWAAAVVWMVIGTVFILVACLGAVLSVVAGRNRPGMAEACSAGFGILVGGGFFAAGLRLARGTATDPLATSVLSILVGVLYLGIAGFVLLASPNPPTPVLVTGVISLVVGCGLLLPAGLGLAGRSRYLAWRATAGRSSGSDGGFDPRPRPANGPSAAGVTPPPFRFPLKTALGVLALMVAVTATTVAVLGYGSGRFAASAWAEFTPPDGSCSVALPGTPTAERVQPAGDGITRGGERYVATGWYSRTATWVGWQDLDPGWAKQAAADRDGVLTGPVVAAERDRRKEQVGGTVTAEGTVRFGKSAGKLVQMDTPRGKLVEQYILALDGPRPRLYFLGVEAKNLTPDSPAARRVFDSFRVRSE